MMQPPFGPQMPMPMPPNPMLPPDAGTDMVLVPPTVDGMGMMPVPAPLPERRDPPTALERWSLRVFGKLPDALETPEEYKALADWVADDAKDGREYWQGRNGRIRLDHDYFALRRDPGTTGHNHKTAAEKVATGVEPYLLPHTNTVPDKMVSMLTGAGHRANLPATSVLDTAKVQQVENWNAYWWKELLARYARGKNGSALRRIAHHLVLDGWSTTLLLPRSDDPDFPFELIVAEPATVYPRANSRGEWTSCTHQFRMSVRDALDEYPEAEAMLSGYDDRDTIACIAYWDTKYHTIVLSSEGTQPSRASSGNVTYIPPQATNGAGNYRDSLVIKRPMRHGITDLTGKPLFPWLIFLPKGDLSGAADADMEGSTDPDTELVGPGVLFAVKETYNRLCQLLSMLLTNVSRSANPPTVDYIREGAEAPIPLSLAPGARNVKVFVGTAVQILDTAPNPADFQPLMTMLVDALNKATFPPVSYGEAGSIQSGYGVGLLQNPALDVLTAFKGESGLQGVLQAIMRRGLEITATVTANTHPQLSMTTQAGASGFLGRPGRKEFDPRLIHETGAALEVTFGELTPQDKAALSATVLPMVTGGILDRYTARQELGYQDPLLIAQRIALQDAMESPEAALLLQRLSAFASDPALIQELAQLEMRLRQQQMQQGQQQRGAPGVPSAAGVTGVQPMPTGAVSLQEQATDGGMAGQAPPRDDPSEQQRRAIQDGMSRASGGSPAAP